VQELFWMGQVLVAATHGRGLFWIDLSGVRAVASTAPTAPATGAAAPPVAAAERPAEIVPADVVPTDPANPR
jgi:hypothetical protein